jgi:glycosyltransferase involved in cell wall biosynthesis
MESVLNQTFNQLEYIIIDGDSKDGTQKEIEYHKHTLSHFISEPDAGIFSAMNKGATLSRGEYLYFLNAGDRIHSTSLFKDIFLPNVTEDLVYGDLVFVQTVSRKVYVLH